MAGFGSDTVGKLKETKLQHLAEETGAAKLAYSELLFNLRQRQARKIKLSNANLTSRQFWKLARKVARKSGGLTAVKDKDRNLLNNFQII